MRWNPGFRTIDGELLHGAALAEALPPEAFEKFLAQGSKDVSAMALRTTAGDPPPTH